VKTPTLSFAPLALTSILLGANIAQAQTYTPSNRTPVADKTAIGTQVSGSNNNFTINGGLSRGQKLFHSFTDFSVPTGGSATFNHTVGEHSIITRVTGNLFSDINGLVNTQGASFFLINPNGMVFGPNAQLNVGKAFVGSTANGIDLVDGSGRTITFGTNPNGDAPLLSINPNVFFNVSRLNMGGGNGQIRNFGTLKTPNNGQYIGLIGGNVTLDGSQGGGKIIAPGGRVDIGGLNSVGTITIGNNGLVFGGDGLRSDVSLINGAGVTVRAAGTLDNVTTFFNNVTAPGSSINISANNLDILNSGAKLDNQPAAIDAGFDTNSGVQTKAAGDINIDATGKVNINNSDVKNTLRPGGEGIIGGIKIQAGTLDVNNNSLISTVTGGKGNAGNIDLKVSGDINLANGSSIASSAVEAAQGNAGNIDIKSTGNLTIAGTNDPSLLQGDTTTALSDISSITRGKGDAGKITINTQGNLSLANRAGILNYIDGTGVGNSEGISINAKDVNLANFGNIQSSNYGGTGHAGNIDIANTGNLTITGTNNRSLLQGDKITALSEIASITQGKGNAGKITINTQGNLSLANRAGIFNYVDIKGEGTSQGISITAKDISLANISPIQSGNYGGKGNAGDINIKAFGDILISGYDSLSTNPTQSSISSDTYGQGDTGKITIDTQGKLSLLNGGKITNSIFGTAVGNSKGISITARELELANSSFIATSTIQTAQVNGKGNAGDINVKTNGDIKISGYDALSTNPIASNISFIESNTYGQGDAGKITIDTQGQGKLSLVNGGQIFSAIYTTAVGNSKGISITARELELANGSNIVTSTFQTTPVKDKGTAGDISINTTGDIKISGYGAFSTNPTLSSITSGTAGQGDAGKITIDTQGQGNLSLANGGRIYGAIESTAVGNSKGISITAKDVNLVNFSNIQSSNYGGKGNAGNIDIKSNGDINIVGVVDSKSPILLNSTTSISEISSSTFGKGDTGKITIEATGDINLTNGAGIFSSISPSSPPIFDSQGVEIKADGIGKDIEIKNARNLNLTNFSTIQTTNFGGTGHAGNIDIENIGNINISGADFQSELFYSRPTFLGLSGIFSSTFGKGDTGKITIDKTGDINVSNRGGIFSQISAPSVPPTGDGNSKGIEIKNARNLTLTNSSSIQSSNFGGKGDAGKITIDKIGKLSLSDSGIYNGIVKNAIGNSKGIQIAAGELDLNNGQINSSTSGAGNAGSIEIESKGKYTADGVGGIFAITEGDGDAGNIVLKAKSVTLSGGAEIQTLSNGKGKAGDLAITTPDDGFINISGNGPSVNGKLPDGRPGGFASGLLATAEKNSSSVAGKIFLKTGTLNIENGGAISTRTRTNTDLFQPNNSKSLIVDGKYPEEPGAGSISIDAKNINITGGGQISATSTGNAPAGDIILKNASTNLVISGSDPKYEQRKAELGLGFSDGYKVENIVDINSGQIVLSSGVPNYEQQKASLFAASPNGYKVENILDWSKTEVVDFTTVPTSQYSGIFANVNGATSIGKGGSIIMNPFSVKISDGGQISVNNQGTGEGGNIFLTSKIATLNNGKISAESKNATGGDIKISLGDYLLLRNDSGISTNSESSGQKGNGGNITISSPLIIALPGNNDITANASAGNGGKVDIISQGLFGIQNRFASPFTSDITASSDFGAQGSVNISTPGTDPGKDKGELKAAPNDASNQISQACSASQRDNKFYTIGRGGHPPNAEDPLTSDVVWRDPRGAQPQPVASNVNNQTARKLAPPAVGWVFDGKGKVTLIAAQTEGAPTGTKVICPKEGK
jgi:filamentous hemagglutinin family protein